MMKNLLVILFFSLTGLLLFSQGETNNWYFGSNAGVTFNSGTPVALTNGALATNEGCASISDKNGNLLFYTDGIRVWDRTNTQMVNGFGLLGDPSSAQSAIIVPRPGNNTRYYVFTVAAQGNPGGFCYSEVDLTLNGGLGDIVAATKNTQLFTPSVEKCTAVKHANGLNIWVIAHGFNNNRYYAYLVTCAGVGSPVISDVGSVEGWPGWGCLTASPDGTRLATAMRSVGFEVLDFNSTTGVVTNPILLGNTPDCYGISFSPNNNLLYGLRITGGSVYQWNLQAGTPAAIIASSTLIGTAPGTGSPYLGGTLQLGPDGLLYLPHYDQPYLAAILSPNTLGIACNLQPNVVDLQGRSAKLGLPPFIQSYFDTTSVIHLTAGTTCPEDSLLFSINGNTIYLDSVRWFFGDPSSGVRNTSSSLSTGHVYHVAGTYTVQLVRYLDCIADTSERQVLIRPTSFTAQNISICPGTSFALPGGAIVSSPGVYSDTLSSVVTGCDSIIQTNLSVSTATISAGIDISVCLGDSAHLAASGALTYQWTPTTGLDSPSSRTPVAMPASTTAYVVSSQVPMGNLIVNGDFNAGNTGFSSSYVYTPPPNTTEGQYNIGPNAQLWNGGMAPCGDHTSGSGNMLQVNGATIPNVSIYCQTVQVVPNTDYAFSTWLATLSPGNLARLQFSINGVLIGSIFTAPVNTCNWQEFYSVWNSGSSTAVDICIVNQNTNAGANDFALDDISFAPLCSATDTVIVTVLPVFTDTVIAAVCQGDSYLLPSGNVVNTSGVYHDTLTSISGCDSVIVTDLTVNSVYQITNNQTICPSDFYRLPSGLIVNTTGIYHDTLTTVNGCDSIIITNLQIVQPNITVSADTAICLGRSATINASGGLFTYLWTPGSTLDDSTSPNPVATPIQTTTYVVHTQVASSDLISNGDFSNGNAGFTSSYTYQSDLTPAGVYYIGANPNTYHSGFSPCPDHTSGSGNMMIINGASTPNVSVWCQTINVVPNTDYAFACWVSSVASGSPAVLQFQINGNLIGVPFTAPTTVCDWQQFYAVWNSGNSTTADICVVNQNTNAGGNDFALDDISFIGLCDVYDSVVVTVHIPVTTVIDTSICGGNTYTFPMGNTSTVSANDTASLTDAYGCDSVVITNLIVNPSPAISVYDTICSNQTYILPSGANVSLAGVYSDTLSTIDGCDSIITTYLTVNDTSYTIITDTICIGESYTLPDGNTVTTSGSYDALFQNSNGCDSIVLTRLSVINILLSAQVGNLSCFNDSTGEILGSATNGISPYKYVIAQGGVEIDSNLSGQFTGLSAGTYMLQVIDEYGCSANQSVLVNQPSLLQVDSAVENVHCFGENNGSVYLSATGGIPPYSYQLSSVGASVSGIFDGLSAGTYSALVSDSNGCAYSETIQITEPQELLVDVSPEYVSLDLGEDTVIVATSSYDPQSVYLWSSALGLSCYDCSSPVATPLQTTTYHLTVTSSPNGFPCMANSSVVVTVVPRYEVFIPNSFTPNGDGVNDFFTVFTNDKALKYLHVQIFNRIGEKVFESDDLHFNWDGTYKGQEVQPSVLVYTLRVGFIDNHSEELYTGSLTLIR